jgi:hypothetical protein
MIDEEIKEEQNGQNLRWKAPQPSLQDEKSALNARRNSQHQTLATMEFAMFCRSAFMKRKIFPCGSY